MKRYLTVAAIAALTWGCLACLLNGQLLAQEQQEAVQEAVFSWGRLISVAANQIVVTEYDYENETETNVTYSLDPNVTLKNAASLKEIQPGSSVEIDYVVRDGQKLAQVITVEKQLEEEEVAPEETSPQQETPQDETVY